MLSCNERRIVLHCFSSEFIVRVMELPWNDFLVKCQSINGKVDTPRLMESDWEWLKQLCELGGEDCWSEVNKSFQQVTLTLRFFFCLNLPSI